MLFVDPQKTTNNETLFSQASLIFFGQTLNDSTDVHTFQMRAKLLALRGNIRPRANQILGLKKRQVLFFAKKNTLNFD